MQNKQISLDPKDLLVILELALHRAAADTWINPRPDSWTDPRANAWTYAQLAERLGLSVSQVHGAVQRLVLAGFLTPQGLKGQVNRKGLLEFLIHGARFMFPAVFGRTARGIRTGASSEMFESSQLMQDGEVWVWPSPDGEDRGLSLVPLHPSVLKAIAQDLGLHKALVHFDALRAGQARERQAAAAYFKQALA